MLYLIEDFEKIIHHTIECLKPRNIFHNKILIDTNRIRFKTFELNLNRFKNIYVIGFGKASSAIATEIEKYLEDRITDGIVITKYNFKTRTNKIKVFEAGHPIPDQNTINHSQKILELIEQATENDLIICLITGGGSALFEVPIDGVELDDLRILNDFLIKQKIPIHKINFYRKAISKVKGGKFIKYIYPSTCISLIISDVVGDDLSVIASGPTTIEDNQSFIEIKDIVSFKKILHLDLKLVYLESLIISEKIQPELIDYYHGNVNNFIISSNKDAMDATIIYSKSLGYEVDKIRFNVSDSVENITQYLLNDIKRINQIKSNFKKVIIYGGESFLEVKGSGKGGRNSHLILNLLSELQTKNLKLDFDFLIASFATDGNDGPTDSAGAFITKNKLMEIQSSRVNLLDYLRNFDSYNFFEKFNCLIKIQPTYTNVMDLVVGLFVKL